MLQSVSQNDYFISKNNLKIQTENFFFSFFSGLTKKNFLKDLDQQIIKGELSKEQNVYECFSGTFKAIVNKHAPLMTIQEKQLIVSNEKNRLKTSHIRVLKLGTTTMSIMKIFSLLGVSTEGSKQ